MTVPSPIRPLDDQRFHVRRRTRLRPVKLVTRQKRFLEDGSAIDISNGGARVRRYGGELLPVCLTLFDEAEGTLQAAVVVWQVKGEVGLRYIGEAVAASRSDIARLGGRYYAV